jgi:hypothetical protein
MSGCGGLGPVNIATTPGYALTQPPAPGPGCTATSTFSSACASKTGFLSGSADSSSNQKAQTQCAPDYNSKQVNSNEVYNSTVIDQGVTLMTKNALTSIAEKTNQMIVNCITNTTSSATQRIDVAQNLTIKLKGCIDVNISNIKQNANIQGFQMSSMTMTQIDEVRTDLATSILGQFQANIDDQNKQAISADLKSAMEAQSESNLEADVASSLEQSKTTDVPSADPAELTAQNLSANTNLEQTNIQKTTTAVEISSPYTSSVEFSKTLLSIINNAVTQNFTKDTMNILIQEVKLVQNLDADAESIGGDCSVKDLEQNANVVLRQTLSAKMNIGTAIVNSIKDQLGMQTDDSVANKNVQETTQTTANDLRSGSTSKSSLKSVQEYIQTLTQHSDDFGSLGSLLSICCCCCCCIISILSSGMGAIGD